MYFYLIHYRFYILINVVLHNFLFENTFPTIIKFFSSSRESGMTHYLSEVIAGSNRCAKEGIRIIIMLWLKSSNIDVYLNPMFRL